MKMAKSMSGEDKLYVMRILMKERGYDHVLTSTQSNELGQFFYRKNKYKDVVII